MAYFPKQQREWLQITWPYVALEFVTMRISANGTGDLCH